MFVLDVPAARRALRDLRKRICAVERLMAQLNAKDDVELYDIRLRQSRTIKMFRLVNGRVADAFSDVYPDQQLFITWDDFKVRLNRYRQMRLAGRVAALHCEEIPLESDAEDRP
jgi:hypothetical protein